MPSIYGNDIPTGKPDQPPPPLPYGRALGFVPRLSIAKVKVEVKSLSRVQLFVTLWTVAYQAPPSMGLPRQEYWPKEYLNYLCNRIESQIVLCLLGYDHRRIDNCPLLTT